MSTDRHLTDDQIQDYLDGNIGPDFATVAEHLEHCPRCRAAVDEYQVLCTELRDEFGFELSPNFAADVAARIGVEHTAPDTTSEPATPVGVARESSIDWTLVAVAGGAVALTVAVLHLLGVLTVASMVSTLGDMQIRVLDQAAAAAAALLARFHLTPSDVLFPIVTLLVYLVIDNLIGTLRRRGHALLGI